MHTKKMTGGLNLVTGLNHSAADAMVDADCIALNESYFDPLFCEVHGGGRERAQRTGAAHGSRRRR